MDVSFDGTVTKVAAKRGKPDEEPRVVITIETGLHGEKIGAIMQFLKQNATVALVDPQMHFNQTFGKAWEGDDDLKPPPSLE